jgi:hypothetical protein
MNNEILGSNLQARGVKSEYQPPESPTYADSLLAQATAYLRSQQSELAVITAHLACEVETEQAMTRLIHACSNVLLSDLAKPGVNCKVHLASDIVYAAYSTLADDFPRGSLMGDVPQAIWWDIWTRSRDKRNQIVFEGALASLEEATAAIESTIAYVGHVRSKVEVAGSAKTSG